MRSWVDSTNILNGVYMILDGAYQFWAELILYWAELILYWAEFRSIGESLLNLGGSHTIVN